MSDTAVPYANDAQRFLNEVNERGTSSMLEASRLGALLATAFLATSAFWQEAFSIGIVIANLVLLAVSVLASCWAHLSVGFSRCNVVLRVIEGKQQPRPKPWLIDAFVAGGIQLVTIITSLVLVICGLACK